MFLNLLNPAITGAVSEMTDEELIAYYLETQKGSYFTALYERYSRKVFGKCVSILKSQQAAEDATQEIFVKLLLKLSAFSGKSKFSTWLYSITYNFCIDVIRKNKKQLGELVEDINKVGDKPAEDNIEDAEIMQTNVHQMKKVLDLIPAGDKAILLMKYQDDFSIKEICGVLDKTESAVKMKIKRAKEKFIRKYDEVFGKRA